MTMKKKYHSLRFQIMSISMIFAFLLAAGASLETFFVSYRYLRRERTQALENNLQVMAGELDSDLDHAETFLNWLQFDSSVSNYLKQASNPSLSFPDYRLQAVTTYQRVSDAYYSSELSAIAGRAVLVPESGCTFIQIMNHGSDSRFTLEMLTSSDYFDSLRSGNAHHWIGIVERQAGIGSSEQVIPVLRSIKQSASPEEAGFAYLELKPEMIRQQFTHYTLQRGEQLYVSIGEGNTYRFENGGFVRDELPDGVLTTRLQTAGWSISLLPSADPFPPAVELLLIVAVLFLLMLLFGFLFSVILRNRITRPVGKLLIKIQKTADGDFSRDPSIEWEDEFGAIGSGINDLSENVDRMMKERVQDERKRQELNYEILQSQINPHFMYNTLNTIKWMAVISGADGISDVATALSRLLKNVAKGKGSLIPLREEIGLVDDYFMIMRYRYSGAVELSYQIEDQSLLDCLVNRFSLQPIVENAIFHGIEPNGRAGKITISVYAGTKQVSTLLTKKQVPEFFIDVTDNGIGMSLEAIDRILSGKGQDDTDFFRHVGVSNVQQRIRFCFGPEFGISIESRQGEYTTMHFHLPEVREGERNVQDSDCG